MLVVIFEDIASNFVNTLCKRFSFLQFLLELLVPVISVWLFINFLMIADLVRKCVEQLVVVHWLESFDGDILKFLEALDVVGCPDVAILVLQSIFK